MTGSEASAHFSDRPRVCRQALRLRVGRQDEGHSKEWGNGLTRGVDLVGIVGGQPESLGGVRVHSTLVNVVGPADVQGRGGHQLIVVASSVSASIWRAGTGAFDISANGSPPVSPRAPIGCSACGYRFETDRGPD